MEPEKGFNFLLSEIRAAFPFYGGSSDLEVVTHVKNAITNLQCDLAVARAERDELRLLLRDVVSHQPDCATDRHGGCADWCPVTKAARLLDGKGGV